MSESNTNEQKLTLDGMQILVVDDDAGVRKFVMNSITYANGVPSSTENGRQALQVVMEKDFDILVVDLKMPDMDGIAFLEEALKIWPWLGVVAITGYSENEKINDLKALGVEQILYKPFKHENLVKAINTQFVSKENVLRENTPESTVYMAYQMRRMRTLTEQAISAQNLPEALRAVTAANGNFLPFDVVTVLSEDQDGFTIVFKIEPGVSSSFVNYLKEEVIERYNTFSGNELTSETITEVKENITYSEKGPEKPVDSISVPIIVEGEIKGILLTASTTESVNSPEIVSFVYYAANQLCAVFMAVQEMRQMAKYDQLTGILNRQEFEREVKAFWESCKTENTSVYFIIMDLDHFKTINDTYGHLIGDKVLGEFAQLLQSDLDDEKIFARYGGEEFVIVSEGTLEDGNNLAHSLLGEVRNHVFCADVNPLRLTVSIGIAHGIPNEEKDNVYHQVLADADQALYRAKRAGRDCVRSYGKKEEQEGKESLGEQQLMEDVTAPEEVPDVSENSHIIVVDDDSTIRHLLEKALKREKFCVTAFQSADKSLEYLAEHSDDVDIVMTDLLMPGVDGFDLLENIEKIDDTLITIVITGNATVDNAVESLRHGAYDFIQKPFQMKHLTAVVRKALDYRKTLVENIQYEKRLLDMVQERSAKISENLHELKASYEFTMEALVSMLDAREKYSGDHSKRVQEITVILAKEFDLEGQQLENISYGALLHDIGKIGIPDDVLQKEGKLTPEEWEKIKEHPKIGYDILKGSSSFNAVAEMVFCHQEFYNGEGYPRGLEGEEIPLGARIFAVADTYDAMRSHRVYRAAASADTVKEEIEKNRATQFDPQVVDVFLRKFDDLERIMKENFADDFVQETAGEQKSE